MASLLKGSKAYVNGQWVEASTGKTFDVKNPVDGKVLAAVPDMSAGDVKVAIDAANKVQNAIELLRRLRILDGILPGLHICNSIQKHKENIALPVNRE